MFMQLQHVVDRGTQTPTGLRESRIGPLAVRDALVLVLGILILVARGGVG